jgi:diadenosine tetraphosphate (Ap4A) HIT family hydrolase
MAADQREDVDVRSARHCVFCARAALAGILAETEHFILLADHAPLVEGHLLIVPRQHLACYGALPEALEADFLAAKRRAGEFLRARYREPIFFEHGVFRQTVFHAHLHAIPFGKVRFGVRALAAEHGRPVGALTDVRDWYAERGHYFYIEEPGGEGEGIQAGVFPPQEERYFHVLGMVRASADRLEGFLPAPARRLAGQAKVRALMDAWRAQADA